MRIRRALLFAVAAITATLASSAIPGRVTAAYPGSENCKQGCEFVAGGWPFPYLVDHPGISPIGSVSLVNGFLGVDLIYPGSLAATFGCWLGLLVAAAWLVRRFAPHASRAT